MSWDQLRDMIRENRLNQLRPQGSPESGVDGKGPTTCPICGELLQEGSRNSITGPGAPYGYVGNVNYRNCPLGHYRYP